MSEMNLDCALVKYSRDDDSSKLMRVKLCGGGSNPEMSLVVAKDTTIGKLKKCYCHRYGLSADALRVLHDGERVFGSKKLLELEDEEGGYFLDIMQGQQSGGRLFIQVP